VQFASLAGLGWSTPLVRPPPVATAYADFWSVTCNNWNNVGADR
jgi:hypothetical protein